MLRFGHLVWAQGLAEFIFRPSRQSWFEDGERVPSFAGLGIEPYRRQLNPLPSNQTWNTGNSLTSANDCHPHHHDHVWLLLEKRDGGCYRGQQDMKHCPFLQTKDLRTHSTRRRSGPDDSDDINFQLLNCTCMENPSPGKQAVFGSLYRFLIFATVGQLSRMGPLSRLDTAGQIMPLIRQRQKKLRRNPATR